MATARLALVLALLSALAGACSGSSSGASFVDQEGALDAVDTGGPAWLDTLPDRGGRPEEPEIWQPPVPVLVCAPGTVRCLDESQPQRCAEDGSAWRDERVCPPGGVCNPGTGACELRCEAGEQFCASPTSAYRCQEGGFYTEEPCREPTPVCLDGGRCATCTPGARSCTEGGRLALCQEDGEGWQEEDCAEEHYCLAGACVACAGSCLSGQEQVDCLGGGLYRAQPCPPGERCFEGVGCAPCLAGQRRCAEGGLPQRCEGAPPQWRDGVACAEGQACRQGLCVDCGAGETFCADAGALVRCDEGGLPETCGPGGLCAQGGCVLAGCAAEVILLLDRSGSMEGEWERVRRSVETLFAAHPEVRFGLLAFPGLVDAVDLPPAFLESEPERGEWFARNAPGGFTPLAPAIVSVALRAGEVWSLPLAHLHRYLVVLSDGEGNVCLPHGLPIPPPASGDCRVDDLAAGAAWLRASYDVQTFAIGYRYEGSPSQLLALVANGGTSFRGYVVAGDEASLNEAFAAMFSDPKYCR